jgi:hypothetical protein
LVKNKLKLITNSVYISNPDSGHHQAKITHDNIYTKKKFTGKSLHIKKINEKSTFLILVTNLKKKYKKDEKLLGSFGTF